MGDARAVLVDIDGFNTTLCDQAKITTLGDESVGLKHNQLLRQQDLVDHMDHAV